MVRILILSIILIGIGAGTLRAEEASPGAAQNLDAVVVTATKTKKKVIEAPGSITVITAEDLKKGNYENMKELLHTVPGFIVQDLGGDNALIGVRVPSQMGAVSQVKVLIDGTDGNLADVDLKSVERIEIVRGPNSALYGANAAGGIINVFTKRGKKEGKTRLTTQLGGFNDQRFTLTTQGAGEKMDYWVSARDFHSDGWRQNSAYQSNIYTGKINFYPDESSSLYLGYGRHYYPRRTPIALTRAQYEMTPTISNAPWAYTNTDGNRYSLGYQKDLGEESNLSLDFATNVSQTDSLTTYGSNPAQGFYNPAKDNGFAGKLKYSQKNLLINGGETVTGIDYNWAQTDTQQYSAPNGIIGAITSNLLGSTSPFAYYLQQEVPLSSNLKMILGGRYDNTTFSLEDRLAPASSGARTMGTVSPKASLNYLLSDRSSVYFSYGQAFTPPNVSQLYKGGASTLPNPNLNPEIAANYEIGYKSAADNNTLSLSVFSMQVKDNIIVTRNGAGSNQYANAGLTQYTGAELFSEWALSGEWSFSAGYTWEEAKFIDYSTVLINPPPAKTVNYSGNWIPNLPKNHINLALKYQKGPFSAILQTDTNDGYFEGADNVVYYPGHTLTDLRLAYDARDYELALTINNLFNVKWIGYASNTGTSESILPGDPFKFFASYTMKF